MRMEVQSLALLSRLRNLCCWGWQLQIWLDSLDWELICRGYGPKKTKRKQNNKIAIEWPRKKWGGGTKMVANTVRAWSKSQDPSDISLHSTIIFFSFPSSYLGLQCTRAARSSRKTEFPDNFMTLEKAHGQWLTCGKEKSQVSWPQSILYSRILRDQVESGHHLK